MPFVFLDRISVGKQGKSPGTQRNKDLHKTALIFVNENANRMSVHVNTIALWLISEDLKFFMFSLSNILLFLCCS